MAALLEGIRILDWTQLHQGPLGTLMLADLGAEVIKLEQPYIGDWSRGVVRVIGVTVPIWAGRHVYYEGLNRNKKSIVINFKHEKGRELIYKLVEKSDVFVHNRRDSSVIRAGMDYNTLRKYNPKLIYASANSFGRKGPRGDEGGFDLSGQAASGMMTNIGEPGSPPVYVYGGPGDSIGGMMLAWGILAGLLGRELHGIGQEIDTSLQSSLMFQQIITLWFHMYAGGHPKYYRAEAENPLWNHYECKDGKWIILVVPLADLLWPNVCRALGIPKLEKDPKYENADIRAKNCKELIRIMDEIFRRKTRAEWMEILQKEEVWCAPVNDFNDVINDPQTVANEFLVDYDHPAWGKVKMVAIPLKFSETPPQIKTPAPEHGEHTEQVLMDVLGYNWDQIAELKEQGVFEQSP